jgi:hypothetical protein
VALIGDLVDQPPFRDWDVRWDEEGLHVAVWIADPAGPNLGRLSLFAIDPNVVGIAQDGTLLRDAPALAGFSIASDRLVWATPPGQNGEGSHILVLAWSGLDTGQAGSQPVSGPDAVVVVR